jgi:hypothetical protein
MKSFNFRSFSSSQNHYPNPVNVRSFSRTRIYTKFNQIWQFFISTLADSSEPTAVWKSDRAGNQYLEVYDPSSQKTYYFESEQAALAWFDTRYHATGSTSSNNNSGKYKRHLPTQMATDILGHRVTF